MKKPNLSNINFGNLIIPIVMGVSTFLGVITDNQKNKKIDELIEKVDGLETSINDI